MIQGPHGFGFCIYENNIFDVSVFSDLDLYGSNGGILPNFIVIMDYFD